MDKQTLAGLMQATELTRAGRLAEATALIQRSLAGSAAPPSSGASGTAMQDVVIEGECTEVVTPPPPAEESAAAPANGTRPTVLKSILGKLRRSVERTRPEPPGEEASLPGQFLAGFHANAAGERAYKLYIPARPSERPMPLIVMLHGCNQSPDDFAAGTRMNALGEEHGCYVLYPAQSGTANHSRCWNWFRREDQARERGEPSIIAGMTREVIERYRIDPRRVYVAGLSAGGAMAAVLAVTYPDLYAAVGIHSGLACGSAHDLPSALAAMKGMPSSVAGVATHAIPTIVFHGDRDRTVHPRNGADVIAASAHHEGGPGGGVTTERGEAPNGRPYTRSIHRDAAGRVLLEHWLVHGGGHAWFGGSRAGSYADPQGPDAAAEMIRFFLRPA